MRRLLHGKKFLDMVIPHSERAMINPHSNASPSGAIFSPKAEVRSWAMRLMSMPACCCSIHGDGRTSVVDLERCCRD